MCCDSKRLGNTGLYSSFLYCYYKEFFHVVLFLFKKIDNSFQLTITLRIHMTRNMWPYPNLKSETQNCLEWLYMVQHYDLSSLEVRGLLLFPSW